MFRKRDDELRERLVRAEVSIERISEALDGLQTPSVDPFDPTPIEATLDGLEARLDQLAVAVAEGIERVQRTESRIAATLQRAQERMEREFGGVDPAVAAEAREFHGVDGTASYGGGVPPMQPEVEAAGDQPSSVPGVSVAHLQRARGLL